MSALGGYTDCCRLLISNGGNVNSIDGNDRTPLHCATVSGSHECMQLLIRQGNTNTIMAKTQQERKNLWNQGYFQGFSAT